MMNTGKLINLPLLKTTVSILAMLTGGDRLIAVHLFGEYGNG
jgi:hypothetical protein